MKRYALLTLSGVCRDSAPPVRGFSRSGGRIFRMDHFLYAAAVLAARKDVDRVLVDCRDDFHPLVFSSLEVILSEFRRLEGMGKKITFYSRHYGPVQLYLSSVVSNRVINLAGTTAFPGLSRTFSFYKPLLDKHGVKTQVFRRGRYKSANDAFRVKKLDPANAEQYRRFQEVLIEEIRKSVLIRKDVTEKMWDQLLAGEIYPAREALEIGWVGEISTAFDVERLWKRDKYRKYKLPRRVRAFGKGPEVAVFHIEGALVSGRTRRDPAMGTVAGAESVLGGLKKLAKNRRIKGVVLRINSPGGSAVASDEIYRGIKALGEKKPLAVSLSEVAGSGGYWIAQGGRRLFVHPTTLTGSIGVIAMVFSWQALLKEWGIAQGTVKTHPSADMGSPSRALTPREAARLDNTIEALYREFIDHVADGRKMEAPAVEELAEGRIWAGVDAVEKGLADETGGILEALEFLKKDQGWKKARISFHPEVKASFLQKQIAKAGAGEASLAGEGFFSPGSLKLVNLLRGINRQPLAVMEEGIPLLWEEGLGDL